MKRLEALIPLVVCVLVVSAAPASAKTVKFTLASNNKCAKLEGVVCVLSAGRATGSIKGPLSFQGRAATADDRRHTLYFIKTKQGKLTIDVGYSLSGATITGAWRVVSGTKRYERATGGGAVSGHAQVNASFQLSGTIS